MAVKKFGTEQRHNAGNELRDNVSPGQLTKQCAPVTITTLEGEVYEIADTPMSLGIAAALAGEQTLRKFWDNPQGDEAWRIMSEEI